MCKGVNNMAQEEKQVTQQQQQDQQNSDMTIAEEAAKLISEKDKRIKELETEMARAKLYRTVDTEEEPVPTREDYLKVLSASDTTNYDYAEAVIGLRQLELLEGRPDPLGEDGEDVAAFLQGILEDCNGDKTAFPALYGARLGQDLPADAAAYKKAIHK